MKTKTTTAKAQGAEGKHTKGKLEHGPAKKQSRDKESKDVFYRCVIFTENVLEQHRIVANCYGLTKEEAGANAQRIVKAVNMHDELIDWVEKLKQTFIDQARDAEDRKATYTANSIWHQVSAIDKLLKQAEGK